MLAKQAELGVEVAEIPSYYLKNSDNQALQSEGKNKFTDKRRLSNFVLISYKLLLREIVITTLWLIMIYENKNI